VVKIKIIDLEVFFDAVNQIDKLVNVGFTETVRHFPKKAFRKLHNDLLIIAHEQHGLIRFNISQNTEGRVCTWKMLKEYDIKEILEVINIKQLIDLFQIEPIHIHFKSFENRSEELKEAKWVNSFGGVYDKDDKIYSIQRFDSSYHWFTDESPQNAENYYEELKRLGFKL
jgi:hypothetical protein